MTEEIKPSTQPAAKRSLAPVIIPWVIILFLLIICYLILARTQLSCHFTGDFATPSAQAAKSEEGIAVGGTLEKTEPLTKTPAYGHPQ